VPTYTQPAPVVTAVAPVETKIEVAAPTHAPQVTTQVEERSDFDRFMNDKNSFVAKHAEEETETAAQTDTRTPSRLIQSIRDAANRYEGAGRASDREIFNDSFKESSPTATRAKSIAEKLGFINFDEDEFDTPSYLRKEDKAEKSEVRTATRDNKNIEI
jgi:cell division protein FtsZ